MRKIEWRRILKRRRAAYQAAHPLAKMLAVRHLVRAIGRHKKVAIYAPIGDELDILPLVDIAPEHQFLLPRIELGDDRKGMIFLPFSAGLEEGPHGVKQPPKGIEVAPDIVVLPLLGMDQQGVRLGYGGGYYDRKLALLPHVHRVGVGFATQLVASLPRAAHDMGLDMMVTDLGILDVDRGALF